MAEVRIDIDQTAFRDKLLHGFGAKIVRNLAADQLADKWSANIHHRTGETQLLISVEEGAGFSAGRTYVTTGEAGPLAHQDVNLSAWKWLEYGTSKMAAQAPGRRALGEVSVT